MTSMTGYAYKEVSSENADISVEIKSVNSRFLDLTINLPSYLSRLEQRFRPIITEKIQRGKVDVYIRIKETKQTGRISADVKAAEVYAAEIGKIAEALGKNASDIPLSLIINQPGVLNANEEYDIEKYWNMILPVFMDTFNQFAEDRKREGANLYKDILAKLDRLDSCAAFFKKWQPEMEQKFRDQITQKFRELLGDHADEQRIMTETAAMLMKYTINEEIVRLHSHLEAIRSEMKDNPAPGKKMDFICQEINREINTIGSKNQFSEVGAMVITAKDSLENIREQSRNIE